MLHRISSILQNKTLRAGSSFAFFSFLNRGLNFFLLIILSWYIMPSSYGQLNLFYTAIGIVGYVICLCTSGIIGIKYFRVSRRELSQYINVVLSCVLVISAILSLCITLFPSYSEKLFSLTPELQLMCVYLCATSVVFNLLLDTYRFEEKVFKYGIITIVSTVINILASLFFVIIVKQDWMGRVEGNLLSSTVFLLFGIGSLIKRKYITSATPTKIMYKETLAYGIPLIPHCCNGFLRQGMDRYIINSNFSTESVGLFSFAINLASIIYTVGSAFNSSNSVYIFKNLSEGGSEVKTRLKKQTIILLLFYLIFSFVLIGGCIFLIPFLFPNYNGAIIYLFPLCMGTFFQCIYLQFCNFLFYYKKTKQLMYMTVSVSLIHLILSLILTQYSVLCTAYISMFTSGMEAVLVYWYSRKLFRII